MTHRRLVGVAARRASAVVTAAAAVACGALGGPTPGAVTVPAPSVGSTAASAFAPAASAKPSTAGAPEASAARGACPADMVEIDADYCTALEQTCLRHRKAWQCAEYAPSVCVGRAVHKHYCVDAYEYPGRAKVPVVMVSWVEARKTCAGEGKRLCTASEWTLACEGPAPRAFPYGQVRDRGACNIDTPTPRPNEARLYAPRTRAAELARLDHREPAGSRPGCVSGFGVYDTTGNVDEWVVNETGISYKSALKGGNWGEYRNACRPVTLGHGEGFRYYQIGFRCCADPAGRGKDE